MDRAASRRNRDRHVRALWYACVSFALSLLCYFALGFSRPKTLAFCATSYTVLNLVSRRQMFGKEPSECGRGPDK